MEPSHSFKEFDDVAYGESKLDSTVLSVCRDKKGHIAKYLIELHEGYTDNYDKVIYVDPDELSIP